MEKKRLLHYELPNHPVHPHLTFHSTICPIPTTPIGYVIKAPPPSCGGSTGRKKPFLQHAYKCLNPNCLKSFKSPHGLRMHFGKLQQCFNFKMSRHDANANTALQPRAVEAQESLTEYPWDEDDSVHESEDASSVKDIIRTGAPNNQASVYTESANDAALRFDIRFTTEKFHETKLLKLLSDANAPHYLCKEVMEWGRAAAHDNYNFNPTRTSRNAQVKYLEKCLQF
jgi:hypothetical protein